MGYRKIFLGIFVCGSTAEALGPISRHLRPFSPGERIDDLLDEIAELQRIEQVVVNYEIPESLERRFDWLSAGDVHVKQDLLNHLRQMEKTLVVEGARAQLPVMLAHLNSADGQHTHRLAQVLKIGKHELEILVDKRSSGVKLEEPSVAARAAAASSSGSYAWVWWVAGILLVIFLLAR